MSMDDKEVREIVKEKLADGRAEAAIRRLKKNWWRPLVPAAMSALLGMALLLFVCRGSKQDTGPIVGCVIFMAVAYTCFWAYRQNRISRALAHKLGKLEEQIEQLREMLGESPAQEDE